MKGFVEKIKFENDKWTLNLPENVRQKDKAKYNRYFLKIVEEKEKKELIPSSHQLETMVTELITNRAKKAQAKYKTITFNEYIPISFSNFRIAIWRTITEEELSSFTIAIHSVDGKKTALWDGPTLYSSKLAEAVAHRIVRGRVQNTQPWIWFDNHKTAREKVEESEAKILGDDKKLKPLFIGRNDEFLF